MLKSFQQFIRENNLCSPHQKILLAISGGLDSICMLNLFSEAGYKFGLAHFNFQLRGEESTQDENLVRSLAEKYQVEAHIQSFDAGKYANENGLSVQEAARELRYQWFSEVCAKYGYDRVALAHHSDDQLETFFINLFRVSGVHGLKGIPLTRENIIRPILFARRSDIESYAKKHLLVHREDSSNASDKYLRNKIRHKLLPEIDQLNTDYRDAILSSLDHLSDDSQILSQLLKEKRNNLFKKDKKATSIEISELLKLNPLDTFLYYLLSPYGFHRKVTDSLCIALKIKETGKLFYSHGYKILIDRERLIVVEINEHEQLTDIRINSVHDEINAPIKLTFVLHHDFSDELIKKESSFAYLDFEKLKFPLTLRLWKAGDRFKPFGMNGKQLVSDYLINHKIDRFEKEKTFVLISDGKISWLIGHRLSDDFKVTDRTRKVLEIQLQNTEIQ